MAAAFAAAPSIAAADMTFPDPDGSGAAVKIFGISSAQFSPGQVLQLQGSGFTPHNTSATAGKPLAAIKPYDIDRPYGKGWDFGGPDAKPGFDLDAHIWFTVTPNTSQWQGWIKVGEEVTPEGPLTGDSAGQHWLRILAGAFATDGGGPNTGNITKSQITYQIPFTVQERLRLGLTGPGENNFQLGKHFRAAAQITPQGTGFAANATVTVKLDGVEMEGSPITTDGSGKFPASARIKLPATVTLGSHEVEFSAGYDVHRKTITVTPTPTAEIVTPTVKPEGRFAFKGKDYIGVGGRGQKVAVVISEQVRACVTAKSDGTFSGSAVVPSGQVGNVTVRFNAGTSCVLPPSPVNDLPGITVPTSLTVNAIAPELDDPAAEVMAGESLSITGSGFEAGGTTSATFDGQSITAALVSDGAGDLTGTVTVPTTASAGAHDLIVKSGATTAVTRVTVKAPPPPPPPPDPDGSNPPPDSGGQPSDGDGDTQSPTGNGDSGQPTGNSSLSGASILSRTAAPALGRLNLRGNRLQLTLKGQAAAGTRIVIRTKNKVRITARGKAKRVTIARGSAGRVGSVRLTLSRDARALLRQVRTVKVVVQISAPGRTTTTRTVTLRR